MPRKKAVKAAPAEPVKSTLAATPVMSHGSRQDLMDQIQDEKSYLSSRGSELETGEVGPTSPGMELGSLDGRKESIQTKQAILEASEPEPLKGAERGRAENEVKSLRAWIREKALTNQEMDALPRHGYIYTRAVIKSKKNEAGNPQFHKNAVRLRELERRLHPDDPEAGKIDRLRKES